MSYDQSKSSTNVSRVNTFEQFRHNVRTALCTIGHTVVGVATDTFVDGTIGVSGLKPAYLLGQRFPPVSDIHNLNDNFTSNYLANWKQLPRMTYRKNFTPLQKQIDANSIIHISSDAGWGCAIRVSQFFMYAVLRRHLQPPLSSSSYQLSSNPNSTKPQRRHGVPCMRSTCRAFKAGGALSVAHHNTFSSLSSSCDTSNENKTINDSDCELVPHSIYTSDRMSEILLSLFMDKEDAPFSIHNFIKVSTNQLKFDATAKALLSETFSVSDSLYDHSLNSSGAKHILSEGISPNPKMDNCVEGEDFFEEVTMDQLHELKVQMNSNFTQCDNNNNTITGNNEICSNPFTVGAGKLAGDWFGPSSAARTIAQLFASDACVRTDLAVHISEDAEFHLDKLLEVMRRTSNDVLHSFSQSELLLNNQTEKLNCQVRSAAACENDSTPSNNTNLSSNNKKENLSKDDFPVKSAASDLSSSTANSKNMSKNGNRRTTNAESGGVSGQTIVECGGFSSETPWRWSCTNCTCWCSVCGGRVDVCQVCNGLVQLPIQNNNNANSNNNINKIINNKGDGIHNSIMDLNNNYNSHATFNQEMHQEASVIAGVPRSVSKLHLASCCTCHSSSFSEKQTINHLKTQTATVDHTPTKRAVFALFPLYLSTGSQLNPAHTPALLTYLHHPCVLGFIGGQNTQAYAVLGTAYDSEARFNCNKNNNGCRDVNHLNKNSSFGSATVDLGSDFDENRANVGGGLFLNDLLSLHDPANWPDLILMDPHLSVQQAAESPADLASFYSSQGGGLRPVRMRASMLHPSLCLVVYLSDESDAISLARMFADVQSKYGMHAPVSLSRASAEILATRPHELAFQVVAGRSSSENILTTGSSHCETAANRAFLHCSMQPPPTSLTQNHSFKSSSALKTLTKASSLIKNRFINSNHNINDSSHHFNATTDHPSEQNSSDSNPSVASFSSLSLVSPANVLASVSRTFASNLPFFAGYLPHHASSAFMQPLKHSHVSANTCELHEDTIKVRDAALNSHSDNDFPRHKSARNNTHSSTSIIISPSQSIKRRHEQIYSPVNILRHNVLHEAAGKNINIQHADYENDKIDELNNSIIPVLFDEDASSVEMLSSQKNTPMLTVSPNAPISNRVYGGCWQEDDELMEDLTL